jgi:hypothetical protein
MSQPFSFGFSGDDIEEDPLDVLRGDTSKPGAERARESGPPEQIPARTHDLDEWVRSFLLSTLQLDIPRFSRTFSNFSLQPYGILAHTMRSRRRSLRRAALKPHTALFVAG